VERERWRSRSRGCASALGGWLGGGRERDAPSARSAACDRFAGLPSARGVDPAAAGLARYGSTDGAPGASPGLGAASGATRRSARRSRGWELYSIALRPA